MVKVRFARTCVCAMAGVDGSGGRAESPVIHHYARQGSRGQARGPGVEGSEDIMCMLWCMFRLGIMDARGFADQQW